jgi:hypothetical protein
MLIFLRCAAVTNLGYCDALALLAFTQPGEQCIQRYTKSRPCERLPNEDSMQEERQELPRRILSLVPLSCLPSSFANRL